MLKTAIPREAGRGTSSGKNVSLAGEEMEGSALPLRQNQRKKLSTLEHSAQGVRRLRRGKPPAHLRQEPVGVRGRRCRNPRGSTDARAHTRMDNKEAICILHFQF